MKQKILSRAACLGLALALAAALSGCLPCPSSAPQPGWDQDGLHAALEQCVCYGQGEAGVSLKTVVAACGMLDWAEDNPAAPADDEISRCVEDWLGEKDLETRQRFWDNWPSIDQQAREILADPDACRDLLASAGNPQRHEQYSSGCYLRLSGCITACEDC